LQAASATSAVTQTALLNMRLAFAPCSL